MTDKPSVNYDDPLASADEVTEDDIDRLTDEIVTEINRPRQGDPRELGSDGYMKPHSLPSFGETDEDCGEPIPFFCTGCGDTFHKKHRCKKSRCPEGAPLWAVDRAENHMARLQTVCKVLGKEMGESVKKHHLVFTPPSANDKTDHDWFLEADDSIKRTRRVVAEILKLLNAEGVIYYHGWSGEQGDDRGEWKKRLFSGRDFEADIRSELKPRPHFHCIVASPFVVGGEVTKRVTEQTGWVIERIADDESGKSLADLTAAAAASTYCISHTSIRLDYGTDGSNRAIMEGFGEKWNSDILNVRPPTRREAERAVRSVSPRTLGISPGTLSCKTEIPRSERGDRAEVGDAYDDADDLDATESPADTADSDTDATTESKDGEDIETVECKSPIKPLAEAGELLEDDEWVDDAIHSEELRRRYQDFQAQAMLDNPPPMVESFLSI